MKHFITHTLLPLVVTAIMGLGAAALFIYLYLNTHPKP